MYILGARVNKQAKDAHSGCYSKKKKNMHILGVTVEKKQIMHILGAQVKNKTKKANCAYFGC